MIVWHGDEPEPMPGWWERPAMVAVLMAALVVLKAASEWYAGY